jgi:hypothetical protein
VDNLFLGIQICQFGSDHRLESMHEKLCASKTVKQIPIIHTDLTYFILTDIPTEICITGPKT